MYILTKESHIDASDVVYQKVIKWIIRQQIGKPGTAVLAVNQALFFLRFEIFILIAKVTNTLNKN